MNNSPQIFGRLVLSCMDSYDSESRRIFSDFSRSTIFMYLCTAQILKFPQKKSFNIFALFLIFVMNSAFFPAIFAIFLLKFDEILSDFREKLQNIANVGEIARKFAKSCKKFWKNPDIS